MSESDQDEQMAITNKEAQEKWAIDVNVDPYSIPLDRQSPN
ncbi:MAG: hypothetical protein ABGY96_28040 [bacterium]